jgi:hypothetical protein
MSITTIVISGKYGTSLSDSGKEGKTEIAVQRRAGGSTLYCEEYLRRGGRVHNTGKAHRTAERGTLKTGRDAGREWGAGAREQRGKVTF